MRHIKEFNENLEFSNEIPETGKDLPENDEIMNTIKELFLEVEDMGFHVKYMAYGSYGDESDVTYRIIIKNNFNFTAKKLSDIDNVVGKSMDISNKCLNLSKELIDRTLEAHSNLSFDILDISLNKEDSFFLYFDLIR